MTTYDWIRLPSLLMQIKNRLFLFAKSRLQHSHLPCMHITQCMTRPSCCGSYSAPFSPSPCLYVHVKCFVCSDLVPDWSHLIDSSVLAYQNCKPQFLVYCFSFVYLGFLHTLHHPPPIRCSCACTSQPLLHPQPTQHNHTIFSPAAVIYPCQPTLIIFFITAHPSPV